MSANVKKLNDVIEHYKRHINRGTEANDNEKIMKCLTKLSRLPITVQNLQKTGIGRVVNGLRKYGGDLGEAAKCLVIQWKNVVKVEESENFYQKDENSDEEHPEVSSTNDNEGLQINQTITSSIASTSYYNNNNNKNNKNNNEPELSEENNVDSSDDESSHHHYHDKSKYKKTKKDKDSSKTRKECKCTSSTDDQGDEHVSKKIKKDHKYESSKTKKKQELEKSEIVTKSRRESDNKSNESVKKDKKSVHSDKKKDKHKSSHKSSNKDKHHESKSSHRDKDKIDSKKKPKDKVKEKSKPSTSTINMSGSSKTFEEALLGIVETGKKKQVKSKCRDRSSSSERESSPVSENMKLGPLNLDPEELIAHYKPLPQLDIKKKKMVEDIDPLAKIMKTKNMRTKVFSGNKTTFYTEVPSLVNCCIQTIKENLDALEFTGGVPFIILEPILKYATPDQLYSLEHYNDYLIEDTDGLWKFHCNKEFRTKVPEKNESWRQFYIRCLEERETKLAKLRRNINANQAASTPVRKTQLAYVDTAVKPPRNIAKKQAKLLTTIDTKRNILNKSMMGENSTAQALSANNKSTTMATNAPVALTSTSSVSSSSATMKKKKAPLMQKALQLIKSTRRR